MKEKTPMPQFMLISQDSMEIPEGFEITPEIIQGIIQKYNDWAEMQRLGGRPAEVGPPGQFEQAAFGIEPALTERFRRLTSSNR
jgi:hypothetical protein